MSILADNVPPHAVSRSGLFVSFEGGDGSGKTTLIRHIAGLLAQRGYPVDIVPEFSQSRSGDRIIERLVEDQLRPEQALSLADVFLFLADWVRLTEDEVMPRLDLGRLVLKDRHVDTMIAYNAPILVHSYGWDEESARQWLQEVVRVGPCAPDLTFYLRVPKEVRRERITHRSVPDDRGQIHRQVSERDWARFDIRDRIYARLLAENPGRFVELANDRPLAAASDEVAAILAEVWAAKQRDNRGRMGGPAP